MSTVDRNQHLERLRPYVERARRMRGWALEYESPTKLGPGPPWDYELRAHELLQGARSVLDLGTGGGELFAGVCDGYRGFAVASEEWAPNVRVAASRLSVLGIPVVHASSEHLPFADGSFGLVLDRHESLDPEDAGRVVARGGHILTQQVTNSNWQELRAFFPRMTEFAPHFELYQDGFRNAGLTVTRAETHDCLVEFGSLGEVAYLLQAAPWTVPDFDLDRDLDALLALERNAGGDGIVLTEGRYIIEASKA